MSEQPQANPPADDRPFIDLNQGDVAFGDLMDALVPDEPAEGSPAAPAAAGLDQGAGAATGAPGGADAAGGGPAAGGPAAPAGDAPAAAAAPVAGGAAPAAGEPAGGGAADAAAASASADPGAAGPDAATILPKIGELSTQFEEHITKAFQQAEYEEVRKDYGKYFEALEKHPRLLVGASVPAIGTEGEETLKTSADAQEWQEAVKSLLVQEIRSRVETRLEASKTLIETVHASIDLFKNNPDLIPGTKGFSKELADSFVKMAEPYEIRDEDDNKLLGYSIPVQPIIDQLRSQLVAAKATPPPAADPQTVPVPGAAATPPAADPPQAAVTSKAGNSSEKDDFSTLFGTIGLPNLQI